MTKLFSATVFLALALSALAKDDAVSQRIHAARTAITEPSYGLAKVKRLVSKLNRDSDDRTRISDKDFKSLTVPEKFTYVMLHGEEFSQNCSAMAPLENENTMIFAFSPYPFGDNMVWSERQRAFLRKNRSAVIGMIRATMKAHRHVGANLKEAIVQITATELVPDVIAAYGREKEDHDLLSVLMLLMMGKKYKPFVSSPMFNRLYGPRTNYQAQIAASAANENLILTWAAAFSKGRAR